MDTIQYKCPNCGGMLEYDPTSGDYSCPYCKSHFSQEVLDRITEEKLGKEEQQESAGSASQAQEDTASQTQQEAASQETGESASAKVYICNSCGAEIVTDDTTAATFCFYCHNPVVLAGRLSGKDTPDYVIPFKIDKKRATEIFDGWMKKKKFVPKSFYSKEQIEKISGVYFPYHLYTCDIGGHVDGTGDKYNVYRRGDVEYTDRITYHVTRQGNMEVRHVLRNALNKADKVLAENVVPYDMEELKPFNLSYLSGFYAEKKDIEKTQYEQEVRQEVRDYAVDNLRNELAGYSNIQIDSDNTELLNEKWEYALFPVWTLTYKDETDGKIYYFSVNGQSGKTIGELPIDRKALFRSFLLYSIPVAVILFLLLIILF